MWRFNGLVLIRSRGGGGVIEGRAYMYMHILEMLILMRIYYSQLLLLIN